MSTLDRYVLREWTKVFLFTVLGFPFLVMVIDLVDKLDTYLGRGIAKEKVALSYVYFLPEAISLVLPVAVLFAVVFTVGVLGRYSELTAAKASGISFHRVMLPLVGASLAAAVLDLGLTELSPVTSIRRAELLGERQDARGRRCGSEGDRPGSGAGGAGGAGGDDAMGLTRLWGLGRGRPRGEQRCQAAQGAAVDARRRRVPRRGAQRRQHRRQPRQPA